VDLDAIKDEVDNFEDDLEPARGHTPPRQRGVSVVIPAGGSKRSSPAEQDDDDDDLDHIIGGPPTKKLRAASQDLQDSPLGEIVVYTKAHVSCKSPVANNLRSSQGTVGESQLYENLPSPKVAFSNSTISEDDDAWGMKFLYRHGGKRVEKMKQANMLW
jgi:hypothetical protein